MPKRPYIIYRPPPGWGFWSNFSCVLQGIDYADLNQLAPVVDMERYPTRYNEDDPILGTSNAWEYYFEQPAELSLSEALQQDPVDSQGDLTGRFMHNTVLPPPAILARGRELIRRYIKVKSDVLAKVDSLIPIEEGRQYLGVHVRGTDLRQRRFPDHPVPSTPITYLEQAILLDKEFAYPRIFLASDELETVTMFEQQFGERLLTIPAHRTSSSHALNPLGLEYDWLFDVGRQHHRYSLGLEVLIDALLLSRCGHLACGVSNVSQSAMYFASETQVVHTITPLWCSPSQDKPSYGKAYLNSVSLLSHKPSAEVLESHIAELQNLLEFTENSRVEAHTKINELTQHLDEAQRKRQVLREKVSSLRSQLDECDSTIERLRQRLTHLINRWTRLGWNLMPWTKPEWRNKPLK